MNNSVTFSSESQEKFFNSLTKKVKCTNDPKKGFLIRNKINAIKYKYIELNSRLVSYLAFDIDRRGAGAAFIDANLPVPTFVIRNPQNGHAHLLYSLSVPYSTTEKSSIKIITYANLIRTAFQIRLGADPAFRSALLTKNPLANEKNTIINDVNYSFLNLAGWLDLADGELHYAKKRYKEKETDAYGRNNKLFNMGMQFASNLYARSISGGLERFDLSAIVAFLTSINTENLPASEVKTISKSIYRFISTHFSPEGLKEWHTRGVVASNIKAIARAQKRKEKIKEMYVNGYTIKEITKILLISPRTAKTATRELKIDKSPRARCQAIAGKIIREWKT